jgi:hypothetical protein
VIDESDKIVNAEVQEMLSRVDEESAYESGTVSELQDNVLEQRSSEDHCKEELSVYYVYAWIRPDGTPYYIGKGKGRRAFAKRRQLNPPPLDRIQLLHVGLSEVEAFSIEKQLIAYYGRRDNGTGILRNLTDGGEGISGFKMPKDVVDAMASRLRGKPLKDSTKKKLSDFHKGKPKSLESRIKLSNSRKGIRFSEDHRKNISKAQKGRVLSDAQKTRLREIRKPISEKTRAKLSESMKGKPKSREAVEKHRQAMIGRKHTEEHRANLRAARAGRVIKEETKRKLSDALRGRKHSDETKSKISKKAKARLISPEHRAKLREGLNSLPDKLCSYCGRMFRPWSYTRYHGDKCPSKNTH